MLSMPRLFLERESWQALDDGFLLTRDPVFQVNSCLWLVRRAPSEGIGARPLFRAHGFDLRALGRRLAFSASTQEKLNDVGLRGGGPEPDVVLRHLASGDHLVFECKAQSFSVDSSTAAQGKKLLAACADADAALAAHGEAYVAYVLPEEDVALQARTLRLLSEELAEYDIECAKSGTLGLSLDDDGLWAELKIDGVDSSSEVAALCLRTLIVDGVNNEARPIYLIPYDPAAEASQDPSERKYCAQLLAERLFIQVISIVGRAEIPACVRIHAEKLLDEATFGVSAHWEAKEVQKFKARIAKFIFRTLNKGKLGKKVSIRQNTNVEVDLADESDRDAIMGILHKTNPAGLTNALIDEQVDVMDNLGPPEFS